MSKEQQERQYHVIFNVWFMNFYFEGSDNCNKKTESSPNLHLPKLSPHSSQSIKSITLQFDHSVGSGKALLFSLPDFRCSHDVCAHTSTAPPLYYLCGVRGSSKY